MNSTILSTKKLTASQQELLLNAGLGFVHYDAIVTHCLHTELSSEFNGYLFTSQNAVRCFIKQYPKAKKSSTFCVGAKTAQYLTDQGFEVLEYADNARSLAQTIVENYPHFNFLHPCGTLRRKELEAILKENNVRYKELNVYDTVLNQTHFQRQFDGVLFFSPSGVQSYLKQNHMAQSIAFCIGETTATEAKKTTNKVVVANKPTIENVLVQSIKVLGSARN